MELPDRLYYLRQYRQYNAAGMVPDVTCDECDVPYFPRYDFKNEEIILWCMECDHELTPGEGIISRMIEYVQQIED